MIIPLNVQFMKKPPKHPPLGLRFAVQRLIGSPRPIPTGFPALDQWLKGGFLLGKNVVLVGHPQRDYFLQRARENPYFNFTRLPSKYRVNVYLKEPSFPVYYRIYFYKRSLEAYEFDYNIMHYGYRNKKFYWKFSWRQCYSSRRRWELHKDKE